MAQTINMSLTGILSTVAMVFLHVIVIMRSS